MFIFTKTTQHHYIFKHLLHDPDVMIAEKHFHEHKDILVSNNGLRFFLNLRRCIKLRLGVCQLL